MVEQLLDELTANLCIDTRRVYLTGLSNGALFSAHLACRLGDRIAAVAVVAFTFTPASCDHRGSIPLLSFHGTADPLVPYYGGPLPDEIGIEDFSVPPVEDEVALWANWNGCSPLPLDSQVDSEVRKRTYRECTGVADVVLYTIEGGGHNWPGSDPDQYLGYTTQQIDATDLILDFFEQHPQPIA
jgi:polyhydroxybutyrate depolymerase